ncbi:MAG TPA: sigma 54-interacting transcriptional regulator [Vicinamibacteria bacterium]|nr:sigma 54-interacting transcriptional regulator [Vicinamibacteria bacterium]
MSDALDVLRSYARAVQRLTGAGGVSMFVPPVSAASREVLAHEGTLPPVPELASPAAALAFVGRPRKADPTPMPLPSECPEAVVYRVPLRWALSNDVPGLERRRSAAVRRGLEPEVWLGLRFETAEGAKAALAVAAGCPDDATWHAVLELGAAVAMQIGEASRGLLDHVTGLPERREFQHELEAALAQAQAAGRPLVLLLLGPDDFGWVNERLDRRSGDRVLREIAFRLRAAVRRQDQVARYGGAIFTVILRDTSVEDARLVAVNLVRRLAEEPYYRKLFRLEFSAGIAGSLADDPTDAHELVRRADQALSAAKRGQVGNVRVWEKGSDVELARSLDRLQGIFTGEKSKDYRNMRLLLDAVTVVAASTDSEHLACSFAERLLEALHARRAGVLQQRAAGGFDVLAGLERTAEGTGPLQLTPGDLQLLERACRQRDIATGGGGQPGEPVVCGLPLLLEDRCLGAILLEVGSHDLSFEGSDRLFLEALASEVAVALDRARLTERERQREREEKEKLQAEVHDLRRVVHGSRLAYGSAAMESLLVTARKVARTDTTVLVTGESGTGKEMLAHTLHELSARQGKPMVVVDCSSISPTLIESELFGHEKGAFTGAHVRNPGRLAQAHGATVFLDEIGDLPLDLQSKLLRFVQEKQFTPVGGVVPRSVDARIIAATNVDLRARVAQGRFREDLFHRLNVVRLHVPPLRERRDDILHLADVFLKQFAALYRRPAHRFTEGAERALLEHPWPGNVRELQNVVLTSVLFCDGPDIELADLQLHGVTALAVAGNGGAARPESSLGDVATRVREALAREIGAVVGSGATVPLGKWLAEDLVLAAERLSGGVHRKAAELLGLPETTYRRQLRSARQRRHAGLAVRTATWPTVAGLLEDLVRARPASSADVCSWAEACLLSEIDSALPGNVRVAAALVGVTEATVLKRHARLRHF